jgi:rod shape-determining protein MreD
MRRAAACAALAFLTVTLQLMVIDRLALPGGSVPDVALMVVVAIGLTQGQAMGMLAGFWTGLGLDLAPPASHLIGESALIFCLVGYGCGRLSDWLSRSSLRLLAAAVSGAVIGETLQAAAGLVVGDSGVTLLAMRHVLPTSALYDSLLSPVVLSVVALAGGRSRVRPRTNLSSAATSAQHSGPHHGLRTMPVRLRLGPVRLRLGTVSGRNAAILHGPRNLATGPVYLPPRALRHGQARSRGGPP